MLVSGRNMIERSMKAKNFKTTDSRRRHVHLQGVQMLGTPLWSVLPEQASAKYYGTLRTTEFEKILGTILQSPQTRHSPRFPRCSTHWTSQETHAPSPQKVTTLWSHCSSLATKNLGQCWVTVDYVDLDPIDLGCSKSQTYHSTNPGLNVLFCNDILRLRKKTRKDAT